MNIMRELRQAFLLSAMLLVICGFLYPYTVTGLGHLFFPAQAEGSFIKINGTAVGSKLVGQHFTDPRFMQGRPSAVGYNTYPAEAKLDGSYKGVASGSENFSASNPALALRVQNDMAIFLARHPGVKAADIPTDLFTASGSGLDPHLSPTAAEIQINALAQQTGLPKEKLESIVKNNTSGKLWGIFGEERVHVLGVNLEIAKALGLIATE